MIMSDRRLFPCLKATIGPCSKDPSSLLGFMYRLIITALLLSLSSFYLCYLVPGIVYDLNSIIPWASTSAFHEYISGSLSAEQCVFCLCYLWTELFEGGILYDFDEFDVELLSRVEDSPRIPSALRVSECVGDEIIVHSDR